MPYKKSNKKRYTRKPPSRRKVYGSALSQLAKDVRKLKDMVNVEYKEVSNLYTASPINWDGVAAIPYLNNIDPGIADNQRIGTSVKCQNLTLRGIVKNNPANVPTSTGYIPSVLVRMIIFWDKQNKTTTGADLLEHVGDALGVVSQKNENNKYDSKILVDRTFKITYEANPLQTFKYVVPINQHTKYNETWSPGAIENGALKMFWISDVPAPLTSEQPLITMEAQLSYTDN